MDQQKYRTAGVQEKLEIIGVEDEAGNPISALTILSLLERVAGIIDNVQSCQQRMEERQLELETNIKNIQGDVMKLAKDHDATSCTVEKLLQKTRKVSANVKEVRSRVEKQNVRVKKVESTQDELLTRNKFRVVIYQVSSVLMCYHCIIHRDRTAPFEFNCHVPLAVLQAQDRTQRSSEASRFSLLRFHPRRLIS